MITFSAWARRLRRRTAGVLVLVGGALVWPGALAHDTSDPGPDGGGFVDEIVACCFSAPTDLALTPDGRILVTQKDGVVWVVRDGVRLPTPFIDLSDEVNNAGDRGLLAVAVDPWFEVNGQVYLMYSVDPVFGAPDEPGEQPTFGRLVRYTADGDVADPASRQVLLGNSAADAIANCSSTHAVGALEFGLDGSLFVSAGEGSNINFIDYGQNDNDGVPVPFAEQCEQIFGPEQDLGALRSRSLDTMAGKLLRIDPATGLGLPDNPFYDGDAGSLRSRIWSLGLRNPFRHTVRPGGEGPGSVFVADVGASAWEEINVAGGGENFQWPCSEGPAEYLFYQFHPVTGPICNETPEGVPTGPAITWSHTNPGSIGFTGAAATGLVFYPGGSFPDRYDGALFFSDFGFQWMRAAWFDADDNLERIEDFQFPLWPVDLELGPDGDLLYISIFTGEVRAIRYRTTPPDPVASASATPRAGASPLTVRFSADGTHHPRDFPLTYSWDFGDGNGSTSPNPEHEYAAPGSYTAVLRVEDSEGAAATAEVVVRVGNTPPQVAITSPLNGTIFADNEVVQLTAEASDLESGDNLVWRWEVTLVHVEHEHPQQFVCSQPTCSFTASIHGGAGEHYSYSARVTVEDADGATASDRAEIFPTGYVNRAPRADFDAEVVWQDGASVVRFDGTTSSDGDRDRLEYRWFWGDGLRGTADATSHVYDQPGRYRVTLEATDPAGDSDTRHRDVVVPSQRLCNRSFEDTGTCWGVAVEGQAGADIVPEAAHTGDLGLVGLTDAADVPSFLALQQRLPAFAGDVFEARVEGFAVNGGWPAGARGLVRLSYLDAQGVTLASHDSTPITEADIDWTEVSTGMQTAPADTAEVLYEVMVDKPGGAGLVAVYFDDAALLDYDREVAAACTIDIDVSYAGTTATVDLEVYSTVRGWLLTWLTSPSGFERFPNALRFMRPTDPLFELSVDVEVGEETSVGAVSALFAAGTRLCTDADFDVAGN